MQWILWPFLFHPPHIKLSNEGAGVAVSLSVIVMEENEDERPFSGELGIELVNWRQNKNHKSINIKFDGNNQSRGIILKLEEYSELTYNSSTNTKYLHNDCLLFKVVFAVAYSVPCCNIIPQWRQQGTQTNSVFEFTLANRVIQRTFYDSKPFFASGYKMQISVGANANGYIGVYVHLMKGPNDDTLIWPFCGDVVVELVNWIEDKNHHRQVIGLSPEVTNKVCNKVLVGNCNDGWGKGRFIHNSSIKPKFLQDDSFYFRVKEVIVHSNALTLKCPIWQSPESVSPYAEFTVTNISKRKEHNTTFYSPAFHSHNEGYKLQLEVERSSDQQHISIYAALLKGQHDDNLVWPFQAIVL